MTGIEILQSTRLWPYQVRDWFSKSKKHDSEGVENTLGAKWENRGDSWTNEYITHSYTTHLQGSKSISWFHHKYSYRSTGKTTVSEFQPVTKQGKKDFEHG